MTADLRLMAYVDGELSPADRATFEAQMDRDPALADAVTTQRRLRAALSSAFDPVIDEPLPLNLLAATRAAPAKPVRKPVPAWAAMAACLVLGVSMGALIPHQPSGGLAMSNGQLTARGALAQALDTSLAADPGPVRIGVSFRNDGGAYCRTFQSPRDRLAGLACRQGGRWVSQATAAYDPNAPAYRQAGADTPPAVLAAVDAIIAGDPMDATAERAARDRGWRP